VALISSREPAEHIEREHLLTESLVLFGPPEVGLRMSEAVPVRALAERDLILTPFPNALRRMVDAALVKAGVPREPQVEVDVAQLMVDLVRQGVGYGVLPYCAVHDLLERRAVSAAPVAGLKITWVVATSKRRPVTLATRKMVETLRAELRTLVRSGAWKTAVLVGE
jgi:LysR family nitrogen assimilation transcriptional regulator